MAIKRGKKYQAALKKVQQKAASSVEQALGKLKESAYAKFDESVDVNINLSIDPSKGEQTVRGSVVLPHGVGKQVRVIVFAKDDYADQALKAGADFVGTDDLVEKITGGWMDFDYAVATPDLMGLVGKLAKILGPRGLLPNQKLGTVTFDVKQVVQDLKKGRMFFRNDKSGLVHFTIGKVSFEVDKLYQNLAAFIKALVAAKPSSSKGKYLKKMTISSTMGVGIQINPDELTT
ncbi:MAG: 50S ribosomal protein L1 [bacterium]|nr:50S ribosomal protein L1 [bacterium]